MILDRFDAKLLTPWQFISVWSRLYLDERAGLVFCSSSWLRKEELTYAFLISMTFVRWSVVIAHKILAVLIDKAMDYRSSCFLSVALSWNPLAVVNAWDPPKLQLCASRLISGDINQEILIPHRSSSLPQKHCILKAYNYVAFMQSIGNHLYLASNY